jgi:DNA-binding NarL/FixJ family response regulator
MKKTVPQTPLKKAGSLSAKWRILIVDDHPLFRQGLIKMIGSEPDLSVCGEADNAPVALDLIRRLDPDLVTVDISLRGTNGLELIKAIKAEKPAIPILTISMHDESLYAIRALRAGASGFIMKQESMEVMMHAVREVLEGRISVSAELNNRILSGFAQHGDGHGDAITGRLSDRELEIFDNIGRGKSVRDIARELNLSIKTVETHRSHIKEKLEIASAREVAQLARSWVESESNG